MKKLDEIFDKNSTSKIPQYKKISTLLESEDLAIVKQAFDNVSDTDRQQLEKMSYELLSIEKERLHEWCVGMLAFTNPNEEQLKIEEDIKHNSHVFKQEPK